MSKLFGPFTNDNEAAQHLAAMAGEFAPLSPRDRAAIRWATGMIHALQASSEENAEALRAVRAQSDEAIAQRNAARAALAAVATVSTIPLEAAAPAADAEIHLQIGPADKAAAVTMVETHPRATATDWAESLAACKRQYALVLKAYNATLAAAGNYVADDATYPTVVTFSMGRVVKLAFEDELVYLSVSTLPVPS